jgi:hypothetical protein
MTLRAGYYRPVRVLAPTLQAKLSGPDRDDGRELSVAHTTILRWVQRFAPAYEKRWNRYAHVTGRSWRADEP